jgi:hypothetical protein
MHSMTNSVHNELFHGIKVEKLKKSGKVLTFVSLFKENQFSISHAKRFILAGQEKSTWTKLLSQRNNDRPSDHLLH